MSQLNQTGIIEAVGARIRLPNPPIGAGSLTMLAAIVGAIGVFVADWVQSGDINTGLAGLAVVAETVQLGRAAGLDDEALRELLRSSPMVAPGLANRVDGLLSPDHAGWFTGPLAAKDLEHALGLAAGAAGDLVELRAPSRAVHRRCGLGELVALVHAPR